MVRAAYCSLFAGLAVFVAVASGQTNSSARWQARYTPIYSDDFEQALGTGSGWQLVNGASVVTDPGLVIAGQASVRLSSYGSLVTNPAVVPLAAHTTYIVELQYRVLSYGSSDHVLRAWMQPPDNPDPLKQVATSPLLKNTEPAGTFSTGAETGSDPSCWPQPLTVLSLQMRN